MSKSIYAWTKLYTHEQSCAHMNKTVHMGKRYTHMEKAVHIHVCTHMDKAE